MCVPFFFLTAILSIHPRVPEQSQENARLCLTWTTLEALPPTSFPSGSPLFLTVRLF